MIEAPHSIREVDGVRPDSLTSEILRSEEPLLLKGLVSEWPLVKAGKESAEKADAYMRRFDQGATVGAFFAAPEAKGRIFYNDDLSGVNFKFARLKFEELLDQVRQAQHQSPPPCVYMGSISVDGCLPGLRTENDLDLGELDPLVSIWIGNSTRIAAHYDLPDNIACCVVGRRRFTLFPPDQLENLYVGPLDFTPAGQAISMVDFEKPDYEKFPKFRQAVEQARAAQLEPGDAIFIPSMWWHHVEGLNAFNVLINYWWRQSPRYMDTPANVLEYAMLSIRDLPEAQRKAWKNLFDHYVFNFDREAVEHIPEGRRGQLSPMNEVAARQIRAKLLKKLNR